MQQRSFGLRFMLRYTQIWSDRRTLGAGSKPTVPMAGIFSIIATESSPHNQLAQDQATLVRDKASRSYRMRMRLARLRLRPTPRNGLANRSTTRDASTIWCDAQRSSKQPTPESQALVNLRNDRRTGDECAAGKSLDSKNAALQFARSGKERAVAHGGTFMHMNRPFGFAGTDAAQP